MIKIASCRVDDGFNIDNRFSWSKTSNETKLEFIMTFMWRKLRD